MIDELHHLEAWARWRLARLSPAARPRLTHEIASELRRHQQRRIAQQRRPDGYPYAPRKARMPQRNLRRKSTRIRHRTMFGKLRTARFFKIEYDAYGLALGFRGRVARLARVHQYGETDRVAPRGPLYRYPARVLLGLTEAERERIRDRWIAYWAD